MRRRCAPARKLSFASASLGPWRKLSFGSPEEAEGRLAVAEEEGASQAEGPATRSHILCAGWRQQELQDGEHSLGSVSCTLGLDADSAANSTNSFTHS